MTKHEGRTEDGETRRQGDTERNKHDSILGMVTISRYGVAVTSAERRFRKWLTRVVLRICGEPERLTRHGETGYKVGLLVTVLSSEFRLGSACSASSGGGCCVPLRAVADRGRKVVRWRLW